MERAGKGTRRASALSVFHRPDAAMPGPWLLLAMALTLTLTDVPSGRAQPEVAQQEAAMATEYPGLDDLLRQAERLFLLREDLQRLQGDQRDRESGEGRVCPGLPGREEAEERADGISDAEGKERLHQPATCLSEVQKLSLATLLAES